MLIIFVPFFFFVFLGSASWGGDPPFPPRPSYPPPPPSLSSPAPLLPSPPTAPSPRVSPHVWPDRGGCPPPPSHPLHPYEGGWCEGEGDGFLSLRFCCVLCFLFILFFLFLLFFSLFCDIAFFEFFLVFFCVGLLLCRTAARPLSLAPSGPGRVVCLMFSLVFLFVVFCCECFWEFFE